MVHGKPSRYSTSSGSKEVTLFFPTHTRFHFFALIHAIFWTLWDEFLKLAKSTISSFYLFHTSHTCLQGIELSSRVPRRPQLHIMSKGLKYGISRERQDKKFVLNWEIMDISSFSSSCPQVLWVHKFRFNVIQESWNCFPYIFGDSATFSLWKKGGQISCWASPLSQQAIGPPFLCGISSKRWHWSRICGF